MHRKIKELIKDILPAGVLITILGLIFVLKVISLANYLGGD
jgi:hypothetical protein